MSTLPSRAELNYVLRAARWQFIWLGLVPGAAAAAYVHLRNGSMSLVLGLGAAGIAIGAAFVMDDLAANTLASVPATLRRRTSVRAVLALATAISAWGYLVTAAWTPLHHEHAAVELVGLLVLALGCAAIGGRVAGATMAGICGASAVAVVLVADQFVLTRSVLLAAGTGSASSWWWALIPGAVLAYWAATRDPSAPAMDLPAGSVKRPAREGSDG